MLRDSFGRRIKDLRISVTDRCNYKCLYCMPANFISKARNDLLSYEEIARLSGLLVGMGIEKIRLTGGEPLVRMELEKLVAMLSRIEGLRDLALTTNGFFLEEKCRALRDAGLRRVNVSLDSLKPERFYQITRHNSFHRVLKGLAAARECGMRPIRVNVVLIRGLNDDEIVDFARFGLDNDYQVRFIEFMPLDGDGRWRRELVVPGREVLEKINAFKPLEPVPQPDSSEPARKYRYRDGSGTVGIIASVTQPFCSTCSRLRLTADGKLRTCLFSIQEHDIKTALRAGADEAALADLIEAIVWQKEEGHHINDPDFVRPERAMVHIGG